MLKLAVQAQLPLVFARSRESTAYLPEVLTKLLGRDVHRIDKVPKDQWKEGTVYYIRVDKLPSRRELFEAMKKLDSTLIAIETEDTDFPGAVDVGDIPTPNELLLQLIANLQGEPGLLPALKGCSPCHEAAKANDFVFTRYAP